MQAKVEQNQAQPSLTALSVAWGFTRALDTEYKYLFNEQELKVSKHLCTVGNQSLSGLTWAISTGFLSLPYSFQQSFFNKLIVPAHDQVVMLRKLMIKSKITEAIQNDIEQVVFLGGGYDIRALMTALNYSVKVYELDRGPTRKSKIQGIQSIPQEFGLGTIDVKELEDGTHTVNDNLFYVECDFITENINQILLAHQFKPEKKKLVIAEGLTAYLNTEENLALLANLHDLMNDEDELLISYINDGQKSKFFDTSLESSGETHRLTLQPEEAISFVAKKGYNISSQFDATRLLNSIGAKADAKVYEENKVQLKEYYITLYKGSVTNHNINEIPFYQIDFPPKEVKDNLMSLAKT